MSNKSQRLSWRARCRRWQRYINALLAMALALVLVLWPAQASASGRCPGGQQENRNGQCVRSIDRRTVCAWPVRIDGERTAYCTRSGTEVQP